MVDYYKNDAKESLAFGNYKQAKNDFEAIINEERDNCNAWVGLLYTSYKLTKDDFEKFKKYTSRLKDKNLTLLEKVALLKKAESLLDKLEVENTFSIKGEVLNEDIKDYKIKNCKSPENCEYCYPTYGGDRYKCSIEYAYLKYKKLSSGGSFFNFGGCNYKDFLKEFKIRDLTWQPQQVERNYLALQSFKEKYETIKDNLTKNYYQFLVKKAKELANKGKFLEALETYNEGIKTFGKLKEYDLKASLKAQKRIFLIKLAEFLERKYKECNNLLCKEAVFLYAKLFPENLNLNLPRPNDASLIKPLTQKYCLLVKINSKDDLVKTHLTELLGKEKLFKFSPNAACDGNFLISIDFNIDTKKSVERTQDYSYYPDLPVDQFLRYWVVSNIYRKSWKYCHCSGSWQDVKWRYYQLKDMINQTLNYYLRGGYNPFESFANYYSYTVSLKGDYTIQMQCIHARNFQACVKQKEAELKNEYCNALNGLCNRIRQEYYSLPTTCPRQIFRKLVWETERIYYDVTLTGKASVDGRKTYLGIFKEIPIRINEAKQVENIYILEGNYALSCQYANDYRFSSITYEGKHFVCIKPHHETVDFNAVYRKLKKKTARTVADRILNNYSPSVFLSEKLNHLKGEELINMSYFFYNVYRNTPFVQKIPKKKVLKEVEELFF